MFAWLMWRPAPYGRHVEAGWGPCVPGRLGWVVMEWPTLVVFPAMVWWTAPGVLGLVLLCLWSLHYVRRTLIYPATAPSMRPMPVIVVGAGLSFQLVNCVANGGALDAATPTSVAVGGALFLVGQAINVHGDRGIARLRSRGESGYGVPMGGLYRYVTNVAYLGELVTWAGWAVATLSLPGLAFAVFTAANLVPRAVHNHRWYRERFSDYPDERRVLVPFVF